MSWRLDLREQFADEVLNRLQAPRQLRKPREPCVLLLEFVQRTRRSAPDDLPAPDHLARQYPCLPADYGVVFDDGMIAKTGLPAYDDAFSQNGTAGDSRLRHKYGVLAYSYVVGYLHEVIDLGVCADARLAKGAAIDGRVASDFNVVFDYNLPYLRKFPVTAVAENVPEAVSANHGAALKLYSVT
jgi:hypothetical protein